MDDEIAEVVKQHGWFAASISDHDPPFLYTIGLMRTCQHPELIIFGLEPNNAHALFSGLYRDLTAGRSYAEPGVYTIALDQDAHRVGFRRVHSTQHEVYLGFAMGFMRHIGRPGQLAAMQVFWPDVKGKFPFDVGCDLGVHGQQPRLDIALTRREIHRFRSQFE